MLTAEENKLLSSAVKLSRAHRSGELDLLPVLLKIAGGHLYIKTGFGSFVEYLQGELKYDGTYVYSVDRVIRCALAYPCLADALRAKRLEIGKATRIVSAINDMDAEALVEFACTHTFAELNAHIAGRQDPVSSREILKQVSGDQFRLSTVLTAGEVKALARVCSLLAQRKKPAKRRDAIVVALNEYLERHDHVKKADRSTAPVTEENLVRTKPNDDPIPAASRHEVYRRSRGICEGVNPNGERCRSDRHVELHHIVPRAQGGSNHPDNLRVLCWAHHDLIHQLPLPSDEAWQDISLAHAHATGAQPSDQERQQVT